MKIGLDLDNTITDAPWLFSILCAGLIAKGHEVHILTYRDGDPEETAEELRILGITYTELHLPTVTEDMSKWKGRLAKELRLDVMIDDSPENLAEMPENVTRLWMCDPEIYNLKACIAGLHSENRMAKIW